MPRESHPNPPPATPPPVNRTRPRKPKPEGPAELFHAAPERMQVVRIEPGDVVVLSYQGILTDDQVQRMIEASMRCFPGSRILALEQGASVGVFRKVGPEDPAASLRLGTGSPL